MTATTPLPFLTLRQAADELGLSPSTLRTQIAAGSLRATKAGRDWLVAPREVARYREHHLGVRRARR